MHTQGAWDLEKKNKWSSRRDTAYKTVGKEFKEKRIVHKQYVKKIVKLNTSKDVEIPKGRKAIMAFLESSDDEQ